jgi:hypothetical protein
LADELVETGLGEYALALLVDVLPMGGSRRYTLDAGEGTVDAS